MFLLYLQNKGAENRGENSNGGGGACEVSGPSRGRAPIANVWLRHWSQGMVKVSDWGNAENVRDLSGFSPVGKCTERPDSLTLTPGPWQLFV